MPQTINTNVASLNAQRNLNSSQSDANTALQRLSSGLRINSAKDDAAGLAISNRLTSQINGINQAVRNSNDGISAAQIAEGALSESGNILQRMRTLAVQSANATNSSSDRAALQAEVTQLTAELDRIASTTAFGETKLLNGSFQSKSFQVGAQVGETITLSIDSAKSSDLGKVYSVTGLTANLEKVDNSTTTSSTAAQNLTFTIQDEKTTVAVAAGDSAKTIAANISSNVGGLTGSASTRADVTFDVAAAGGATDVFEINGVSLTVDLSAATTIILKADALEAAINADSTLSASLSVVNDAAGGLQITDADGDNISVSVTSSTVNAGFDIGSNGGATVQVTTVAATKQDSVVTGAITLTGTADTTTTSDYKVFSDTGTTITAGTSIAQQNATAVTQSTSRVDDVDLTTVAGANTALGLIDSALTQIDSQRADLGAVQNRFESVIANLSNVAENSSAARSRIQDADFAQETANLARAQILQQAGISVLAQANAQPQNVLALLQ